EAAMADQAAVLEQAPRGAAALLPGQTEALDRGPRQFEWIAAVGPQPFSHLGVIAHGSIGFGIAVDQRPQRQALGLERGHGKVVGVSTRSPTQKLAMCATASALWKSPNSAVASLPAYMRAIPAPPG